MSVLEEYCICTRCGKRPTDGIHKTCDYCREQMRNHHRKNAKIIMENNKKVREEHKAKGLCIYCNRPAKPGRVTCEIHLEKSRKRYRNRKKQAMTEEQKARFCDEFCRFPYELSQEKLDEKCDICPLKEAENE